MLYITNDTVLGILTAFLIAMLIWVIVKLARGD